MTREQLEHVLRSACQIAGDRDVLIIRPTVIAERIEMVDVSPAVLQRLRTWIAAYQ